MCARAQRLFLVSAARILRAISRINIHRCLFLLRATFFGGFVRDRGRTMLSQSSSTLGRMLESPFSHRELYGISHPSGARKKGKRRRVRRRSSCRKNSTPSDSCKAGQRTSRKTKSNEVDSTTTAFRAARKTPSLSLPMVDYDSPKVKVKQRSAVASRFEMNPSIAASTSTGSPVSTSALASGSGRRFPVDSHIPLKFNPLQGCICHQVDKLSLNGHQTRGLLTATLHGGRGGKTLPVARRWWGVREFTQGPPGVHNQCPTLENLARGLAKGQYQKIVVMSGAGISTSSGIPDFRTPGTGLYDNLQQYNIPEPSAIFDITYFFHNPKPFFTLAKELYPGNYSPNAVHYFVRLLQEKGILLRNYTQNIDGLERIAGVKPLKLIEAHGSFLSASCTICHTKHDPQHVKELIFQDKIPKCKQKFCSGLVKPDIVFFGEDLPSKFHSMKMRDFSQCDLLLVLGTSLEVEPFASLATTTRFDVPRILINREAVGLFKLRRRRDKDMTLIGDLVNQVWELVRLAGWKLELEKLIASVQESRTEDQDIRCDGTVGESPLTRTPHLSTPGSGSSTCCADDPCESDHEQRCAPQQGKKGAESSLVSSDSGDSLEHVRQTFDKLLVSKSKTGRKNKDHDDG